MWKDLKRPMRWRDRLRLLLNKPGWLPEYLGGYRVPPEITKEVAITYDTSVPEGLNYYILVQYVLILGVTTVFLFNIELFSRLMQICLALFIIISIMNIGGILEFKNWSWWLEWSRWLGCGILFFKFSAIFNMPNWMALPVTILILLSVWLFYRFKALF
jgi:hypothetical protein